MPFQVRYADGTQPPPANVGPITEVAASLDEAVRRALRLIREGGVKAVAIAEAAAPSS